MTAAERPLPPWLVSAASSITAMAKKVNGVVSEHASGLTIRNADLSRSRPFRWAWNQRVLMGYINLQVGEEGIGKGNLTAWQAARITRGELDGDLKGEPRSVLFIGDEDSWDHIWVPRLHAAGADLERVFAVAAGTTGGVMDVRADADALREYVEAEDVALVYFDQLLDNLGVTDNWKDKDVRDALAPIRRVVQDVDVAVLASMHPNKRGGSFRDRVSGSPAFNALSRSSLLVARHPEVEDRVVVVRAKGNYSIEPPAFEFRIEERVLTFTDRTITTSRIADISETGLRQADVLDGRASSGQVSVAQEARALLAEMFPAGAKPRKAKEVLDEMRAEGFTEKQAQDARKLLGLKTWKEDVFQGGYVWGWKADDKIKVREARKKRRKVVTRGGRAQ